MNRFESAVKRGFDIVLSLFLSILFLLPSLATALLIVIRDPGNPFYAQERVGKNGKAIRVMKFRTMRKDADALTETLEEELQREYFTEYKLRDDPRLIGYRKPGDGAVCFGGVLRRISADELPQLFWNIFLLGDMSLVGPRPILRRELEQNYTPEEQEKLLSVKPGLTGYWQAYARNNAGYRDGKRQKMEMYYVENRSLWLDIKILFATVNAVLSRRGAE